jgi:Ni/Co efflux regulator RcnB
MKLRNLLLALVAFAVLAGSVVPAQAAGKHHKHGHHHKKH